MSLLWPMDCSPPGSSVHGISQARVQEWVAISLFRGSSIPRDQTWVSCIAGGFFTTSSAQLENILDNKIQKDKKKKKKEKKSPKPNCHFWRARSKTRQSVAKQCSAHVPYTQDHKGWADQWSHPFGSTPGHTPALTPCKEPAHPHFSEQAGETVTCSRSPLLQQ